MTLILALILSLYSITIHTAHCAEPGITIERRSGSSHAADRERIAKNIYKHTFENLRDPDTGILLPESAAITPEMWPDFWEAVRAVGYPEYLIPGIRVVEDTSGLIPGEYRDSPNHALQMDYDGTRVGVRTRVPVPVDPALAYEFSAVIRDEGLQGARIRAGVDWLRIDPSAAELIRSDEVPNLLPGQEDWPVVPARMLVNDPPPNANAARLFVTIDRDPTSIGGAYHGSIWIDDVALKSLPKIRIDAPRPSEDGQGKIIPVRYSGLSDNIPDPANPGYFKGRRYTRQVEITDVHGQSLRVDSGQRQPVTADDTGLAVEDVPFLREKYGVYYFNIRLYDADDRLATDVMRAVAVMRPVRKRDGVALHSARPVFGINSGIIPPSILSTSGTLRNILERSGVKTTKIVPWTDDYAKPDSNNAYYAGLTEELRYLRTAGIGVYGIIKPPSAMFDSSDLFSVITTRPQQLQAILEETGRHLGLLMDGWQWGDDDDPSLKNVPPGAVLDGVNQTVREFAGGLPDINTVVLENAPPPTFPLRHSIAQGYLPETEPADALWRLAARVFPWLLEPYFNQRGQIYPPQRLAALAPKPAQDKLEEQARQQNRVGSWLSLDMQPAYVHEPNAPAEKKQLEEMLVRSVYAAVLSPDVIFLGSLFDPVKGLLRRDIMGTNTLETMARPAFLAAGTVSEFLEGAEYLGELWLLPPFEAHVFRKPGSDESIIALWHNDTRDVVNFPRQELATGPALQIVDWAGNVEPVAAQIPVRRVPSFVIGMPAGLALTRMSMRINPDVPVLASMRRQNQVLEIVNHMTRQSPVLLRLRYAARMPGGAMERSWDVKPEEMRINLAPHSPQLIPGQLRYTITPDPNSQIQSAGPDAVDKSGQKIAQVSASFSTAPPADMLVYLPFQLRSDIDVDVERLVRVNDPNFVTLQLRIRWYPSGTDQRRAEVKLTPYYMKRGQMKESTPFPVTVKASPPDVRGREDAPFEAVELRVPRRPHAQTWVGLDEVGGSNFYIIDVTGFMNME